VNIIVDFHYSGRGEKRGIEHGCGLDLEKQEGGFEELQLKKGNTF
jgi:hypothetical protein